MADGTEQVVDKLQDIMDDLPDSADDTGAERREYSLTRGDVMLIYKIARIANQPYVCPFDKEESSTLQSVAKNINKTQKITSILIITGVVTGTLSGIWYAIVHILTDFVRTGGGK
jgi:predicted secreted protein